MNMFGGVPGDESNRNHQHQSPVNNDAMKGISGPFEGLSVNYPNRPFPPEVRQWLSEAQKNGRFFFMCAIIDPKADKRGEPFNVHMFRSVGFDPDWMLKAWKLCGQNLMAIDPESVGKPVPEAREEDEVHDGSGD